MSIRKSPYDMYQDSIDRSQTNILYAYDYDETHMLVINHETKGEYLVDVDHDTREVLSCECPHYIYRLHDLHIPCKHTVFVADKLGYTLDLK